MTAPPLPVDVDEVVLLVVEVVEDVVELVVLLVVEVVELVVDVVELVVVASVVELVVAPPEPPTPEVLPSAHAAADKRVPKKIVRMSCRMGTHAHMLFGMSSALSR